ncbi:MAG: hypothetical protein HZY73_10360 [Micropruina sp.]|nr:MAG: hypothetical protein HZY73_10360 [Micropruina sp.]
MLMRLSTTRGRDVLKFAEKIMSILDAYDPLATGTTSRNRLAFAAPARQPTLRVDSQLPFADSRARPRPAASAYLASNLISQSETGSSQSRVGGVSAWGEC